MGLAIGLGLGLPFQTQTGPQGITGGAVQAASITYAGQVPALAQRFRPASSGVTYSGQTPSQIFTQKRMEPATASITYTGFAPTVGNRIYYIPHYGQSLSLGQDPDGNVPVSTTGSAATITGATQANPVVITTSAAHGFSNGDEILIASVGGMTELNGRTFEVANVTSTTLELYEHDGEDPSTTSLDGALFTAYTSGGTVTAMLRPTNAYMFNGGVRINYDDPDTSNVNDAVRADTIESLHALNERRKNTDNDFGETFATGIATALSVPSLQATTGRAAYPIIDLSRSDAQGFVHFGNTFAGMAAAYDLITNSGASFALGPMLWKQGEADGAAATSKSTYKTSLQTLISDFEAHMKAATFANRTLTLIADQQALSNANYAEIAVAIIELHRSGDVVCLGPGYANYVEHVSVTDLHLTATGYRRVGEKFGQAIETIIGGGTWNPCYITAASRSGTTITLTINVPSGALVKDTSAVSAATNDGFTYSGAGITAVTITDTGLDGTGAIEITIDADAGGTLSYAYNNGTANQIGPSSGARGNIRDSDSTTASYDSTPLYNWLCTDQWVIA